MTSDQEHLAALAASDLAARALAEPEGLSPEEEVRWALRLREAPGPAWLDERRRYAALRLHAIRRLREALDPAFDPEDVPALSLAPPGGLPAGVAPEALADPAQRAEYEALLAKNRDHARAYAQQKRLHDLSTRALPALAQHLATAYATPPPALDELARALDESGVDGELRASILAAASPVPDSGTP